MPLAIGFGEGSIASPIGLSHVGGCCYRNANLVHHAGGVSYTWIDLDCGVSSLPANVAQRLLCR